VSEISLYARLAAYAVLGAVLFGGGWYLGGLSPKRALAVLEAQDWQAKAQASDVALKATQAQLKALADADAKNAGIIKDLNDANLKTAADRDRNAALYQRLLHRPQAAPPSGSAQVPAAAAGQGASGPGGTDGADPAGELLADASAECHRNSDRLDALIEELLPQLSSPPP
jgi:hypothetical protein